MGISHTPPGSDVPQRMVHQKRFPEGGGVMYGKTALRLSQVSSEVRARAVDLILQEVMPNNTENAQQHDPEQEVRGREVKEEQ